MFFSFAGISARRRALPLSHWLFLADQRGGLLHIDQLLTKPDLFWTGKLVVPATPFCCCLCEIRSAEIATSPTLCP